MTVTDPEVTRFFMTIGEAVQLVIQAGALGRSARCWCSTWVSRCGSPTSPADLIAQSATDVEIVYTGLRPGEKLHEELLGDGETDQRPRHPLISHAAVPPLDPAELLQEIDGTREWMSETCASTPLNS